MKAFLVGGAVRDQLLNYPYTKNDWVVIGCTPEEMYSHGFTPISKDFPVFLHPETKEKYALARTEKKVSAGSNGFTFNTSVAITLEEDLKRRDLTINAMAQLENGTIIDPYGGQNDLKQKRLRHVSSAFKEDPLRLLRVARFSARYHHLGFRIARSTNTLMHEIISSGEVKHLVPEHIWQELNQALQEISPEQFLRSLRRCRAIPAIFPDIPENKITTCIEMLSTTGILTSDPMIRFTALCHPLKLNSIVNMCDTLRAPKSYSELAILTKKYYHFCCQTSQWSATSLADFFQATDALRKPERLHQLLVACHGIYRAEQLSEFFDDRNKQTNFKQEQRLLSALDAYKRVNHQEMIARGFRNAALVQAIEKQRLTHLSGWLETV